jgi:hypothetical protein
MRKLVGGAVVAALVLGGVLEGVASAASSTTPGGVVHVYVTPNNGASYPIVFVGAIGDHGTATTIDKSGKVNSNGNYVRIRLTKGTFEVNSTVLNKKTNNAPPTVMNTSTCSFAFTGSGPVTLFNGTGAYAGISGTIRITQTFAGIGPLYAKGSKKGECNLSNNSQPVAFWGSITGVGAVKFT